MSSGPGVCQVSLVANLVLAAGSVNAIVTVDEGAECSTVHLYTVCRTYDRNAGRPEQTCASAFRIYSISRSLFIYFRSVPLRNLRRHFPSIARQQYILRLAEQVRTSIQSFPGSRSKSSGRTSKLKCSINWAIV
jgi:hypothetical protein